MKMRSLLNLDDILHIIEDCQIVYEYANRYLKMVPKLLNSQII